MKVKVKSMQRATKPHRLAEASTELADSHGDSLTISDNRYIQGKLRRIQNLLVEFIELVKEHGAEL